MRHRAQRNRSEQRRHWAFAVGLLFSIAFGAGVSAAGDPSPSVAASSDVTIRVGALDAADEDVLDDLLGGAALIALGALPDESELTAYHVEANGDHLFALHSTVVLPGAVPLTPAPGDVIRFDGSTYTLEFDASMAGLPDGTRTDALSRGAGGLLLLSFDITAEIPTAGQPITVADEDIVSHDPSSGFSLVLDGSVAGIPNELDVDAVAYLGNGGAAPGQSCTNDSDCPVGATCVAAICVGGAQNGQVFALSFDGSGRLGAIDFDDEDVLELDPTGPTWTMYFDASAQDANWSGGPDLDAVAVPEPSQLALGLSAAATLMTLRNRRNRRVRALVSGV